MGAGLRLGWADVRARPARTLGLVVLVAVPLVAMLLLDGYAHEAVRLAARVEPRLVVQQANTIGEIAGSRIPASVRDDLADLGITDAVPEIHEIAGERIDRGVLLRGVDPERYRDVTATEIVAGRHLRPDDPPRSVLLGRRLADRRGVGPGDVLDLRGRPFSVVGVFRMTTLADNEAWVPLVAAQDLLGWGSDVSVFVVPDDGTLSPGDLLPGGLSVARRGDVDAFAGEWMPLTDLIGFAARALEVGAAAVLALVLWRLAWLRRTELGILRLLGLPRRSTAGYVLLHAGVVGSTALGSATVGAVALAGLVRIEAAGFPVEATITPGAMLRTGLVAVSVLSGTVLAVVLVVRRRPVAELLRRS